MLGCWEVFWQMLPQCQGNLRERCCHFCGLFICGLLRMPCQELCNTWGLCLYINRWTFCCWSTSWSCKLSGSKDITKSHVCFCRLVKCFGMQILQSWLYGWKTWRWKSPSQTLMVRTLHGALALNACLQMSFAMGITCRVGDTVEAYQWLWHHCAGVMV